MRSKLQRSLVTVLLAGAVGICLPGCCRCAPVKTEMTNPNTLASWVGHRVVAVGNTYDSKAGTLLNAAIVQDIPIASPVIVQFKASPQTTQAWPEHLSQRKVRVEGVLMRYELYSPQDPNAIEARLDGDVRCVIEVDDVARDVKVFSEPKDTGR